VSSSDPPARDPRLVAIDEAVDDDALIDAVALAVAVRVPHTISTLRHRLKSPIGPAARTAVVVGIIRLGEDALLREVAQALHHDDVTVVVGAARILGAVGDVRAVPNLVEALKTDDAVVGAAVIEALGQLGDAACVPWLLAAVEHRFCAVAACAALGRLGDARSAEVLRRAVDDDDRALALAAAQALVRLQEQGVVA
jgi:HEAT repeat protein